MKKYVTPSLLNVDAKDRLATANTLVQAGIKWIHYDIMDGEFVENTAITVSEIANISKNGTKHLKDAHLMVMDPYSFVDALREHCDFLTFHYEAILEDEEKFDEFLSESYHELKIGLAIKPETPVEAIEPYLDRLALVLVMSVQPGRGGQKFMPIAVEKIKDLYTLRLKEGYDFLIQVDGGINNIYGPMCFEAGADAVVAGTYLIAEPTPERIDTLLGKYAKHNK